MLLCTLIEEAIQEVEATGNMASKTGNNPPRNQRQSTEKKERIVLGRIHLSSESDIRLLSPFGCFGSKITDCVLLFPNMFCYFLWDSV